MISVWLTVAKVVAWVAVTALAAALAFTIHSFIGYGPSAWVLTALIGYGWALLVLDIWDWVEG